jgi:hypothetical protein
MDVCGSIALGTLRQILLTGRLRIYSRIRYRLIDFDVLHALHECFPESRPYRVPSVRKWSCKVRIPKMNCAIPNIREITLACWRSRDLLDIDAEIAHDENQDDDNDD